MKSWNILSFYIQKLYLKKAYQYGFGFLRLGILFLLINFLSNACTSSNNIENVIPSGLPEFKKVSVGWSHTIALKENGLVFVWGARNPKTGPTENLYIVDNESNVSYLSQKKEPSDIL